MGRKVEVRVLEKMLQPGTFQRQLLVVGEDAWVTHVPVLECARPVDILTCMQAYLLTFIGLRWGVGCIILRDDAYLVVSVTIPGVAAHTWTTQSAKTLNC